MSALFLFPRNRSAWLCALRLHTLRVRQAESLCMALRAAGAARGFAMRGQGCYSWYVGRHSQNAATRCSFALALKNRQMSSRIR